MRIETDLRKLNLESVSWDGKCSAGALIHQSHDISEVKKLVKSLRVSSQSDPIPDEDNLRSQPRYDVNWSAMLRNLDNNTWVPIYVNDISERGIGFAHGTSIPEGCYMVSFKAMDQRPITALVRLIWCKKIDDGMHRSGGEFLGVLNDDLAPW